jgi:hypothetical protein
MAIYDEQYYMENQKIIDTIYLNAYMMVPINMLKQELKGIYGNEMLRDIQDVIKFYGVYEKGRGFIPDCSKDFYSSELRLKRLKR